MARRPERDLVEEAYTQDKNRKAHEIAQETGLIDSMGYDKAVDYVRRVKKDLKKKGLLKPARLATDDERLRDIETLLELRKGRAVNRKVAYTMLMLNCYYRLRSPEYETHITAIDNTYEKNRGLKEPFTMADAIQLCGKALEYYMRSIDETLNEEAKKKGFPGAGLNYGDSTFVAKLEITDTELEHMTSIEKG